jgi:hypothetical protein
MSYLLYEPTMVLETLLLHGQAALLFFWYFAHFREPQQWTRVYLLILKYYNIYLVKPLLLTNYDKFLCYMCFTLFTHLQYTKMSLNAMYTLY